MFLCDLFYKNTERYSAGTHNTQHTTHNTALLPAVSQKLKLFQVGCERTALQTVGRSLLQPLGERRLQSRHCPVRRSEGLSLLQVAVPVSTQPLTDIN